MVTREEAQARGWKHFFVGDVCRHGHVAPRAASNPDICTDCYRVKDGKEPIGAKARHRTFYKPREAVPAATASPAAPAATQPPLEPNGKDKAFLAAYAEFRDIQRAAQDVGSTPALIEARRACNPVFAKAIEALETQLGIARRVFVSTLPFEWTDEKRGQLVRTYIDTGDIKTAQDAIGVSPSQFFDEESSNPDFAAALARAKPLAARVLEAIAQQRAIAGDSKLLDKIWTANRQDTDTNPTEKLTVEQLRAEAIRIIREFKFTDGELDLPDGGPTAPTAGDGHSDDEDEGES